MIGTRRKSLSGAAKPPRAPRRPPEPDPASYTLQAASVQLLRARSEKNELKLRLIDARNSNAHSTEHFNAQPVGFLLLDDLGKVHETNRRLEQMLGTTRPNICAGNFAKFVVREDLSVFLAHLRRARHEGQSVRCELSLQQRGGHRLPVQLITAGCRLPDERVLYRTCVLDNSERLLDVAKAAQTRYRYQTLLNTVEGVVWEAEGPGLDVTFVSGYAQNLLGFPIRSWFSPGFWENHIHFDDRDRVMQTVAKALADNSNFTVDYRVFTADRQVLWLHDNVNVQRDEGRVKFLGIAVDITEQKAAERKLQTTQGYLEHSVAERTAELRETVTDLEAFSYSMSHDLRAPLRAIQGYSELLQQSLGDHLDPTQNEFFERIKNSTGRMDSLIQDVLTYSRVARAPLKLEPLDVGQVVDNVIRDYPGLQPPHAEIKIAKPLAPVTGHPAFLTQCISNLLWNAVKFVHPGRKPRVCVHTVPAHNDVEIWVEDNGIGIPNEHQKRIFGMFQRLHSDKAYEGTGIGLAIVQKAVERMGGRVGVESTPGHGSKFWLRLHGAERSADAPSASP